MLLGGFLFALYAFVPGISPHVNFSSYLVVRTIAMTFVAIVYLSVDGGWAGWRVQIVMDERLTRAHKISLATAIILGPIENIYRALSYCANQVNLNVSRCSCYGNGQNHAL